MRTPEEIRDALRRTCPLGEFVLDDNEAAIVMETAIREARAAALEEAARVVEHRADVLMAVKPDAMDHMTSRLVGGILQSRAEEVRALQEPPCPSPAASPPHGPSTTRTEPASS